MVAEAGIEPASPGYEPGLGPLQLLCRVSVGKRIHPPGPAPHKHSEHNHP